MSWDQRDLPSQRGTTVVVTGAGRGVGYFTGEQLAAAGARVILTTRSATPAAESIRSRVPGAVVEVVSLELGSIDSIRAAAAQLDSPGPIDVLIYNAGQTSGAHTRETTSDRPRILVGPNADGPLAPPALPPPADT